MTRNEEIIIACDDIKHIVGTTEEVQQYYRY